MKPKPLILSILLILLLVASFLSPWTRPLWTFIDTHLFTFLNATLDGSPFSQHFWALLNHKRMDLVEDGIFLLFFIWGVSVTPKGQKLRRTFQFILISAVIACVIGFINRGPPQTLFALRDSPSLVITPCVRITQEILWKGIKDATTASFPGDHATTLLLFGFLYTAYVPRKLAGAAWFYVALRILPRLVVGAHWFSDIAVGSLSIALFFAACFLYTPLGRWLTEMMEWGCLRVGKSAVKRG